LRAIRFAASWHFQIDPVTLASIETERERLKIISQERITDEIMKNPGLQKAVHRFEFAGANSGPRPDHAEIAALQGVDQIGTYRHKDVFITPSRWSTTLPRFRNICRCDLPRSTTMSPNR